MRYGNFRTDFSHGNEIITILVGLFILAMIVIIAKSINKNHANNEVTANQKETLDNFEGLVCAMLTQHGFGLRQHDISSNLELPLDLVSEKLNEMEKEGIIIREWVNDEYTYLIKLL